MKEVNRIEKSLSKDLIYKDTNTLIDKHTENLQKNYEKLTGDKLEAPDETTTQEDVRPIIKESD